MTDLVVPWTPNPDTVAVKTNTTNETVASGKYAICKVTCKGDGKFYIDDALAFEGYSITTVTGSSMDVDANGALETGGTGGAIDAYTFTSTDVICTHVFEVPSGTDLKVAGTAGNARYTLALYNEIT